MCQQPGNGLPSFALLHVKSKFVHPLHIAYNLKSWILLLQSCDYRQKRMDELLLDFRLDGLIFLALRTRVANVAGTPGATELCRVVLYNLLKCAAAYQRALGFVSFVEMDPTSIESQTARILFGLTTKEAQVLWLTLHGTLEEGCLTVTKEPDRLSIERFVTCCLLHNRSIGWPIAHRQ